MQAENVIKEMHCTRFVLVSILQWNDDDHNQKRCPRWRRDETNATAYIPPVFQVYFRSISNLIMRKVAVLYARLLLHDSICLTFASRFSKT